MIPFDPPAGKVCQERLCHDRTAQELTELQTLCTRLELALRSQCALDMTMHGSAGPWKVNPRWVLDSEKFNEWMNPVDYETEEAIAEQERLGLLIEGPSGA